MLYAGKHEQGFAYEEVGGEKAGKRLERFLEEKVEPGGRSERRHWACVYVEELLLDGERKSMEPIATRSGAEVQVLRQFVGSGAGFVESGCEFDAGLERFGAGMVNAKQWPEEHVS